MSFRDDADALLARNDALERDNAELRERCERLEAELVEARKPPPKPKRSATRSAGDRRALLLVGGGFALAVLVALAVALMSSSGGKREVPASRVDAIDAGAVSPWRDATHRWHSLHALLHCRRNQINRLGTDILATDTVYDPRGQERNYGEWMYNLSASGCEDELPLAARDRDLPQEAVAALARWSEAEAGLEKVSQELGRYYMSRDFVDDDLGLARTRWPELRAQVKAVQEALLVVGRDATQAIRDDVLATVAGRDDAAAWRGRLHVALDVLDETLYLQPPDPAAVTAAATRFREQAPLAPIEVRRLVRPVSEALDTAPLELAAPVFRALYDVTPGSYPAAELR